MELLSVMNMKNNPFRDIERLLNEMDSLVNASGRRGSEWGMTENNTPVDVTETEDEVVLTADIPGYAKSDISLKLGAENQSLIIQAQNESEETVGPAHSRHRESIRKQVPLPSEVVPEETTAEYTNGVLTVTMQKRVGGEDTTEINIE